MTDQQPTRPIGLRIITALVGFIVGLWSLFVPKEIFLSGPSTSFHDECNMVQWWTTDSCGWWDLVDWAPQLVGSCIAGYCLWYAFKEKS